MTRIILGIVLSLGLLPATLSAARRVDTAHVEIVESVSTAQAPLPASCRHVAPAAHRRASAQCQAQGYAFARLVPTAEPLCAENDEGADASFQATYQCVEQSGREQQAPTAGFDSCDDCYNQVRPDKFCRDHCGCASVFCGAW